MVEEGDEPKGLLDKMERLEEERKRKKRQATKKPSADDELDLGRIG